MKMQNRQMQAREIRFIPLLWRAFCHGIVFFCLWLFLIVFSVNERRLDAFLGVITIGVVVHLLRKYPLSSGIQCDRSTPIILFLLCFVTRLAWCEFVNPMIVQVSDFEENLRIITTGFYDLNYYRIYTHKLIYPLMIRTLGIHTEHAALVFQCFLVSFIPPLIYHMGKRIRSPKTGLLAALIYLVWPGHLVFISAICDEHIIILILTAISALLIEAIQIVEQQEPLTKKFWLMIASAGVLSGLCALLIDYAAIFLIAMTLSCAAWFPSASKKQKKIIVIGVLVLLSSRVISNCAVSALVEHKIGLPTTDSAIVAQMYMGLDPNRWGGWTAESIQEYHDILADNEYDLVAGNHVALSVIRERIKANADRMPDLFFKKGVYSFADEHEMFVWVFYDAMQKNYFDAYFGEIRILEAISRVFYLSIICCVLLAPFFKNRKVFLLLVITIGCLSAQLLMTAVGRYKYMIEPLWAIIASYVIVELVSYKNSHFLGKEKCSFK